MANFSYKAKNKSGEIVEGELSAKNKDKLLKKLRNDGLTPLDVQELKEGEHAKKPKAEEKEEKKEEEIVVFDFGVSEEEKAFFTTQFTTMLNAGLTLDRILNILYRQTKSRKLKAILYEMAEDLQKGSSISGAMKKHPQVFDGMYLSMVEVGETSGSLPTIFERLARIIQKNLSLKRTIKAAFSYPTFILVFSSILSYVLLAVFLPQFVPMFNGVGLDIDHDYPLTALLIRLSKIATNPTAVLLILGGIVAVIVLVKLLSGNKEFKKLIDSVAMGIPFFGDINKQAAMARFCRSFSYLTSSGVPILNALNLIAKGAGNALIEERIIEIAGKVREGKSLSKILENDPLFPDIVVQMLSVGEESGSIPEMMEKTADYLDEGVDNAVNSLTRLMEPAMMVCVGIVVAIFVMGVLVPIFGITSKLT